MLRLSEEQRAILNCYFGTKGEVTANLWKAVPFIEDVELREMTADLLAQIEKMGDGEVVELSGMLDAYNETESKDVERMICLVE